MTADRFAGAIDRIDAANADDPEHPKEQLYSQRMTACLDRFAPEASEVVKLADVKG